MNKKNRQVIEEFRANGGVVTVTPPHGPVLILHSAGARSGRECVTPLIYREGEGRYVVCASMGGWKRNPDWYFNLVAHPDAWIEVGSDVLRVTAVIATGAEREELFLRHAEEYPQFAYYQGKTSRVIPVIVLIPAGPHEVPSMRVASLIEEPTCDTRRERQGWHPEFIEGSPEQPRRSAYLDRRDGFDKLTIRCG